MAAVACGKDGFPIFPSVGLSAEDVTKVWALRDEWTKLKKAIENVNEGAQKRARTEKTRQAYKEQFAKLTVEKERFLDQASRFALELQAKLVNSGVKGSCGMGDTGTGGKGSNGMDGMRGMGCAGGNGGTGSSGSGDLATPPVDLKELGAYIYAQAQAGTQSCFDASVGTRALLQAPLPAMKRSLVSFFPRAKRGRRKLNLCDFDFDTGVTLGKGKYSVVHPCWHKGQPMQRYVYKLTTLQLDDTESLNRIREEIRIMQVLGSHPRIMALVCSDWPADGSMVVPRIYDLCEGGALYDKLSQKGRYSEQEGRLLCRNIFEGLQYIHSKGIMHRDIKPEVLLLKSRTSDTDIKISDFGLARASSTGESPRARSICGSDFYIAPEIIREQEYGCEVDIWSAGVVSYVILSGSLPFFHDSLAQLYRQIIKRDIKFPPVSWADVSDGALEFIIRLLRLQAPDRLTAEQALDHSWLHSDAASLSSDSLLEVKSLRAPFGPLVDALTIKPFCSRLAAMRLAVEAANPLATSAATSVACRPPGTCAAYTPPATSTGYNPPS